MKTILESEKFADAKPWLTFFTPTYNRKDTIHRCYESLIKMKHAVADDGSDISFEWIIVDDGSRDDTWQLIEQWYKANLIPIKYLWQENCGKHVATNRAVGMSRGDMLLILDSDDTLFDNALEVFYNGWMSIPSEIRHEFKGVTARCVEPGTDKLIGTPCPTKPYYVYTADMRFRDHIEGEMCGINRLDVMKEFPFPVFETKTSFCPESIVWFEMGKKYKESIIDVPVREYFRDTANSITLAQSKSRATANYHLWKYEVNNLVSKYFFSSPKEMSKAVVGISRDGFLSNRSVKEILNDVDSFPMKALVLLAMPVGWFLSKK